MHAAIVHFAPVLAAEKSKVPFFIAGGVLVAWALIVSMGIGMRNPSFPATVGAERLVMAITAVLVLAAVSTAIATSGSGTSSLKEEADPEGQLAFTTKDLSAKAGTVTIGFGNSSPLPHNLTVAHGTKVLGATPTFQGATKTLVLKLAPGTYTFYCSVPGHRQGGMEGKLTVQ